MVIFYGSNSWSYTPLEKIDGATVSELKRFLGSGSISLILSPELSTGIEEVSADCITQNEIYDLNGNKVTKKLLASGMYIVNGKKTLIRN